MRVTNAERAQSVTRSTPSHQHQWGREELQTRAGIKLLIIDVMGFTAMTAASLQEETCSDSRTFGYPQNAIWITHDRLTK